MTKRSRLLLTTVVVIVALVAGVAILIPAYLASGSFRDRVRAGLAEKLDRPVELASLRISLLPAPRIKLTGMELGPPNQGPRSWIAIEDADLSVRLGPLLRRQVEVVSARIDSMVVRVEMPDSAGVSGATGTGSRGADARSRSRSGSEQAPASETPAPSSDRVPESNPSGSIATGSTPGSSGFDIAIEDFQLTRGAVHVVAPDGRPSLDLGGVAARLRASSSRTGDIDLSGSSSASLLRIYLPGGTLGEGLTLTVDPALQYRAATDELAITKFDLDLGGLPIAVTGKVANVKTDRRAALEFSGGPTAIDGILGFLPSGLVPQLEGVRSSGIVSLRGALDGSLLDLPPHYEVALSLADGSLTHPQLPEPVTDLTLSLHADPETIQIEVLHAASANSRIDVTGTIDGYRLDPSVDLRIQGDADLALVAALQSEPDTPNFSGRVSTDLVARGPLRDPARPLRVDGTIVLDHVSAEGGSLERPIRMIDGTVQLSGSALTTEGVSMEIGRSDYRISGTIADYRALLPESSESSTANLRVSSRRLDLDELNAKPMDGSASSDSTPRGSEAAVGNAFFAMLGRLEGPVTFAADQMIVRNVETRSVDAAGRLQNGLVTLDRARLAAFGGTAAATGTFDLRDLQHPRLDLDLDLQNAEASQLFQQAVTIDRLSNLGGYLSGTFDLSAKLAGSTDAKFELDLRSLTSTGKFSLAGGKLTGHPLQSALGAFLEMPQLANLPIREWLQPFSIENGRLQYQDLKIEALGAELHADGWQSLDGQIGMNATLLLPPELSQGLRRYVPKELQSIVFEPQGGRIAVPIAMSGPAQAPRITLDSQKLEDQAKARLAEKVGAEREKLEEKLEDELTDKVGDVKDRLLDQLSGGARGDSVRSDSTDLEEDVRGVLEGLFKKKK